MWSNWEIHRSEQEFVASRKKEILILKISQEPYFEGPQVRICTRLPVVAATLALHNTPLAVTRCDWGSEVVVPGLHEVVDLTYLTELNHCKR